jgi:prevent-host-death family protein
MSQEDAMYEIPANELKTKGVSVLKEAIVAYGETVITVRGKPAYVVLSIDEYNRFREQELAAAVDEAHDDIKAGRYHTDIAKHVKQVTP